jgi:hypothetical protein
VTVPWPLAPIARLVAVSVTLDTAGVVAVVVAAVGEDEPVHWLETSAATTTIPSVTNGVFMSKAGINNDARMAGPRLPPCACGSLYPY